MDGDLIHLTQDPDAEVRAQTARLLGDLSLQAGPALIELLQDESLRIKSVAALSLGKIGSVEAVSPLLQMIREAGIQDPYLRHGAVMGLSGCAQAGDLAQLATDPSAAVRMSAVLALRRLADPGVSRFLRDARLEIVTAAARAIYDVPIESALPKLAALLGDERILNLAPAGGLGEEMLRAYRDQALLQSDDGSLRYTIPLILRVVNANWRVGKPQHAEALAGLARSREVHWLFRGESLRRLAQWDGDAVLDPLLGVYRPFAAHPRAPGRRAALTVYEGLLKSDRDDLLQATMALVGHYEIKEAAAALARLAGLETRSEPIRSAALESLTDIGGTAALEAVRESLDSPSPRLRGVALRMLARLDPPAVTSRIERTLREGETLEKQAALELVSKLGTPETNALLLELMEELQEKTLDPAIQLDVLEACEASEVPELQARVARFEEQADEWDDFGLYRTAIAGGDERIGRGIFFFNSGADCKRCHVINEVGGGMVGPDLTDVNERLTGEDILESVVAWIEAEMEFALSQAVASGDTFEHRPSECGHCVQDFLADLDLRDLPGEAAGSESGADDALPPADLRFYPAALVVPCGRLPGHAAVAADLGNMAIPNGWIPRRLRSDHCVLRRRYNHIQSLPIPFPQQIPCGRSIIGAVRQKARDRGIELIQEPG